MAMSRDRIDSSVPALVKRGFIGLMKIGEIDGLVIAWREVNVAQFVARLCTETYVIRSAARGVVTRGTQLQMLKA